MRLRRAFSHAASIPWLVFLWGAAEIGERVEYIADKERLMREFVMSPAGEVGLVVLGFFAIIGVIVWPDIKHSFSWIKLEPSAHDRLRSIEQDHLPAVRECHEALTKRAADLDRRVSATESDYSGQRQHSDFIDKLIQQKLAPRLDMIEREAAAIIAALGGVPEVIVRLCEYAFLLHEAMRCAEMLSELRALYPSSAVAITPFSATWRPLVGVVASDDVRDGVRWIRSLEAHWKHIEDWHHKRGTSSPELLVGDLNAYVSQAKLKHFDVSGAMAEKLLTDHLARIKTLMDDYAAAVSGNASVILTMSRIDQAQ